MTRTTVLETKEIAKSILRSFLGVVCDRLLPEPAGMGE